METLLTSKIVTVLKIAGSLVSLVVVLYSVDLIRIANQLSHIHVNTVLIALVIFWLAQFASSLRCVYVARTLGGNLAFLPSLRAHFVGLWFNQVLPTSLGGDMIKIAMLKKNLGMSIAVKSALLDRFSGLFLLMLIILLTLPLYSKIIPDQRDKLLLYLSVLSWGFISGTITLSWFAHRMRSQLTRPPVFLNLVEFVSDIWTFKKIDHFWKQIWTSSLVHFNGIAAYGLLGVALGFDINVLTFTLLVPLVSLIALLPVSFAGWGTRELGAVWVFGLVGISKEHALAMSLAYGLLLIIAAVPGVFCIIFEKNELRSKILVNRS
jgi:hypothetical protein